jgi:predicted DCC family thiol-disulfide oxidoreductase YuxK
VATRPDTIEPAPELHDGSHPLIVFDGVCVLCSGLARVTVRLDRSEKFRFATAQSPLGQALYAEHGLRRDDFDTNLVIIDGVAHQRLDSLIAVAEALGWPWRAARALRILPKSWREALYGAIARNRYWLFGRKESCDIPSPELRARIVG